MSDFKAKMHKIRFLLWLRPQPRCGRLQRSPRPSAVFKGPTSKGRVGKREERGKGGKVKGKGRRGEVRKGEGREGEEQSPSNILAKKRPCGTRRQHCRRRCLKSVMHFRCFASSCLHSLAPRSTTTPPSRTCVYSIYLSVLFRTREQSNFSAPPSKQEQQG